MSQSPLSRNASLWWLAQHLPSRASNAHLAQWVKSLSCRTGRGFPKICSGHRAHGVGNHFRACFTAKYVAHPQGMQDWPMWHERRLQSYSQFRGGVEIENSLQLAATAGRGGISHRIPAANPIPTLGVRHEQLRVHCQTAGSLQSHTQTFFSHSNLPSRRYHDPDYT